MFDSMIREGKYLGADVAVGMGARPVRPAVQQCSLPPIRAIRDILGSPLRATYY